MYKEDIKPGDHVRFKNGTSEGTVIKTTEKMLVFIDKHSLEEVRCYKKTVYKLNGEIRRKSLLDRLRALGKKIADAWDKF